MSDQLILAQRLSRFSHDASSHEFAPLWIRYAKDCCFTNRRVLVDDGLNLARIDIFAAGDDHVLETIQDIKVPIWISVAEISRAKETIPERLLGFFRIIPIAAHDIRASRHQFAMTPGFKFLSRLVHDPQVDSRASSPT